MNLEPVALAAEALAKACRFASLPTIQIVEPTFTTSPRPADLHPMCDAELDRLMTQLADRAAEYGQGSVAETMKAIRAFVRRKFDEEVERKTAGSDREIERLKSIIEDRCHQLDIANANLSSVKAGYERSMEIIRNERDAVSKSAEAKDVILRGVESERDQYAELLRIARGMVDRHTAATNAAREVVREMTHCMRVPEKGDGFTRFVVPTNEFNDWLKRAGISDDPEAIIPIERDENDRIRVAPLTGHATGCTPDRCVPACPNPRGKR